MRANDDTRQKHWFDGHTRKDHIRDAAHLLARVVMLVASIVGPAKFTQPPKPTCSQRFSSPPSPLQAL